MEDSNLPELPAEKGTWDEKDLSRRRFFEITFWTVTGITAVGVLGIASRYLIGDSLLAQTSSWVPARDADGPAGRLSAPCGLLAQGERCMARSGPDGRALCL